MNCCEKKRLQAVLANETVQFVAAEARVRLAAAQSDAAVFSESRERLKETNQRKLQSTHELSEHMREHRC